MVQSSTSSETLRPFRRAVPMIAFDGRTLSSRPSLSYSPLPASTPISTSSAGRPAVDAFARREAAGLVLAPHRLLAAQPVGELLAPLDFVDFGFPAHDQESLTFPLYYC